MTCSISTRRAMSSTNEFYVPVICRAIHTAIVEEDGYRFTDWPDAGTRNAVCRHLSKQLRGDLLGVGAVLEQALEELAALGQLHHQVPLAVGRHLVRSDVVRCMELHDVRMAVAALERRNLHV